MAQPPPAVHDLARRLLWHEAGGAREPETLAAAVDRACGKLYDELENLVGPGGLSALIRRALNLAEREFPFLGGVTPEADSRLSLRGLPEALRGRDAEEAEAASAAVLAYLVGLLVNLLGEDLGLRPVRKIWPEVTETEP